MHVRMTMFSVLFLCINYLGCQVRMSLSRALVSCYGVSYFLRRRAPPPSVEYYIEGDKYLQAEKVFLSLMLNFLLLCGRRDKTVLMKLEVSLCN